jgi:hypothetical protein
MFPSSHQYYQSKQASRDCLYNVALFGSQMNSWEDLLRLRKKEIEIMMNFLQHEK